MINIAGVFIEENGKILLVQEKQPQVYGLWNIPAGHVDKGETFEEAAKREGEEESGYKIEILRKIKSYPLGGDAQMHVYQAKIVGGSLNFDTNELLDVEWFTKEDVQKLNLRESFIKEL